MDNTLKNITDGLQLFADLSTTTLKASMENVSNSMTNINRVMAKSGISDVYAPFTKMYAPLLGGYQKDHECCPPEHDCPPGCILNITRTAFIGERIIVPFVVRNKHKNPRQYKLGVRPLESRDGTVAPSQPILNKSSMSLKAGESAAVVMTLDLQGYPGANTYSTEIVIREKDINQNICFTINVEGLGHAPVVEPLDEKKYTMKWQSWRSHFYCEPQADRITGKGS